MACDHCAMDRRADRLTAVHVDLAVNVAGIFGMYSAICYLHEKLVPIGVVYRVILELGPRRGNAAIKIPRPYTG